ncbi:MAG: RNA 2',3'-cyclic phosphodiesterase [Candidatus Omnitrophica bacterium]|nr:RNA 2',3'-cyclic phosphodiesterase [Candidatus Omnitrophota bacterium]
MRCFVAIKLSKEVKDEIVRIQNKLQPLELHAKWTEYENLHITLKFLGQIPEENITEAKEIVSGVSSLVKPFTLNFSKAGAFPSLGRPRVLWVGVEPDAEPVKIIEYLEEQFQKLSIPRETRPPHPHITLARIKSPENTHKLKSAVESLKVEDINWEVKEVVLFKSILTPRGAIYEEIFSVTLP